MTHAGTDNVTGKSGAAAVTIFQQPSDDWCSFMSHNLAYGFNNAASFSLCSEGKVVLHRLLSHANKNSQAASWCSNLTSPASLELFI